MDYRPSKSVFTFLILSCFISFSFGQSKDQAADLKVVIIRHAEKPLKGDNLTCQGLNRSLQLPAVLYSKYGIPAYTFVPSLGLGAATKHGRMFQTAIPLAAKYNLVINSKYEERDSTHIAADIKSRKGTVLMIWEHKAIPSIVRALGVSGFNGEWGDNDYDSIWIISFSKGVAVLSYDKESLFPAIACPF